MLTTELTSAGKLTVLSTELPAATLDVTIVVPYYNPGPRLRTTVEHMVRVMGTSGLSFEIITVSDGSTDGSQLTLEGIPESVVRQIVLDRNTGKGHALRVGLGLGRGRYLGFIDADGDLPPELLAPFVTVMRREQPDIIIGSKRHPDSSVHYPLLRRLYSSVYQRLVFLLFHLNVKDTQVGIKLVDRAVITEVLPLLRETRFALDVELLVLAQRLGYVRIMEVPVRIQERFASTISVKAVWQLLVDTLAFFVRFSVRKQYDPALRAVEQARASAAPASGSDAASGAGEGDPRPHRA